MGVTWLFKEREAIAQSGFYYLDRVIDYMNSLGWGLSGDARQDSKFRDLEFLRLDGSPGKIIAEAKGGKTQRSPFIKEIKTSILKYLLTWIEKSSDKRAPIWFFLSNARKQKDWEALFSDESNLEIRKEYLSQLIELTDDKDKELLESRDLTEIDLFFMQAKLVVGTTEDLRLAADMNRSKHPESLLNQLQQIKIQREKDETPEFGNFKIVLGLAPLEFKTRTLFVAELPKITVKEIFDTISNRWNLGFYKPYRSNLIWTFENVEAPNSAFQLLRFNWMNEEIDDVSQQIITSLSNITIRNILERENIRHIPSRDIAGVPIKRRNLYFSPPKIIRGKIVSSTKVEREGKGKKRIQIARAVKGLDDDNYAYFYHIACEIKVYKLFKDWTVILKPQHWFTRDGYAPLAGNRRKKLEHKYRNPLYNIPSTWLNRTEAWHSKLRQAFKLDLRDYFDGIRLSTSFPFRIGKLIEIKSKIGPQFIEEEE